MNNNVKKLSNGDFEVEALKKPENERSANSSVRSYVSNGRSAMPLWQKK